MQLLMYMEMQFRLLISQQNADYANFPVTKRQETTRSHPEHDRKD